MRNYRGRIRQKHCARQNGREHSGEAVYCVRGDHDHRQIHCDELQWTAATISVNLVTTGGSAGNTNLVTKTKTLQPAEVYTFPELVGQVLNPGDFISTLAGTAGAINMRVSGREVT